MPLSSSNAVRQLSDANSLGTILGQSVTDKIGFYGMASTGVAIANTTVIGTQYATSVLFVTSIVASTIAGTIWGFQSSTQGNAVVGLLDWAYRAGVIR
jgi:hypothetical protein